MSSRAKLFAALDGITAEQAGNVLALDADGARHTALRTRHAVFAAGRAELRIDINIGGLTEEQAAALLSVVRAFDQLAGRMP